MAATTQDLLEVHTGVMGERLRKVVRMGMKHVKQCLVSEGGTDWVHIYVVMLSYPYSTCTVHVRLQMC